jgi:glycosyltransferase involved in cell wall biosynthesis
MSEAEGAIVHPPLRKLIFLARSLDHGGAERQLTLLAGRLRALGYDVQVVVFYPGGALEAELHAADVPVYSLDKRGRWALKSFLGRMLRFFESQGSAIVHGYLPVPNLMTLLIKFWVPRTRAVFGVRASNLEPGREDRVSRWVFALEQRWARYADLIIVNSQAGREHHIRRGFPADKLRVIPNGIDTDRFQPNPEARAALRAQWAIPENTVVIGLVGRLDPMKDHRTFLRAAARFSRNHSEVRFVCIGGGEAGLRTQLRAYAHELCIDDKLLWLLPRDDMQMVYPAFDLLTSASAYGEGFSNAIGEAMACGVPCVVTDVGDSAWIVGDTGIVVPARSPELMMNAWQELLDRRQAEPVEPAEPAEAAEVPEGEGSEEGEVETKVETLAERARARIVENFGVDVLVSRTLAALGELT